MPFDYKKMPIISGAALPNHQRHEFCLYDDRIYTRQISQSPPYIHFNPQISQITQIMMNVGRRLRNLLGLIPSSLLRLHGANS